MFKTMNGYGWKWTIINSNEVFKNLLRSYMKCKIILQYVFYTSILFGYKVHWYTHVIQGYYLVYIHLSVYIIVVPLLYGYHLIQWENDLIRRMAFLEENNLVLYCLSASKIWPLVGGCTYEGNYSIDILPVKV